MSVWHIPQSYSLDLFSLYACVFDAADCATHTRLQASSVHEWICNRFNLWHHIDVVDSTTSSSSFSLFNMENSYLPTS